MTEEMTLDAAAEAMREATRKTVRRGSLLYLIQGILLVIAGVLALVYPLITNVALAIFLGWMLLLSGIVQAVTLIGGGKTPDFWLQLISAALSVIVGFLFLRNPAVAVGTLVMLMSVFFMIEGISKTVFSLTIRPFPNWGWVLASGILGILIAVWLLANPAMSLLLLGILIGVQLVAEGIAIATMAWMARKETR
ncbi:MAG: hypothetical protein N838_21480 [Thiohalocapsa sp. PB-PSB1]|jgi:uncharacterized membrane protein HdeD (DUF308 family)|nr:MAG: hypothetical protein N838_21480 [Thiohalocapsa sp. PB-PSB1]